MMRFGFNIDFADLTSLVGLRKIDELFCRFLSNHSGELSSKLIDFRKRSSAVTLTKYSEFIISVSPILDDFLEKLFNIERENSLLKKQYTNFDVIYECRRKFVQRFAVSKYPKSKLEEIDFEEVSRKLQKLIGQITERSFAEKILEWQVSAEEYAEELDIAAKYAAFMVHNNSSLVLFDVPRPTTLENLIRQTKIDQLRQEPYLGFNYRDKELTLEHAAANAKYCIYCHKQNKDSCSKGTLLHEDKDNPFMSFPRRRESRESNRFKDSNCATESLSIKTFTSPKISTTSWIPAYAGMTPKDALPLSATRFSGKINNKSGCPLKQKISEMNLINSRGFNIAALAVITIDNPLVAATGHRICNDCMKACIFQKQDPVNVPLIESKILDNVLGLPYGVEIYLLLTKWNPLNISSPLPQEQTGKNVLVTGLGPAGFALSHYLLNDGHNVTAIDGLKITPLPFDPDLPVKNWSEISEPLSEKTPQGFGGVAEYGITNRWNKNNLTLIRLILERRPNFNMYGGVRLGSNITTDQAFSLGFDHIALCIGAGRPKFINSTDFFAKGVRSAADFLMTLQQGGAYLSGSLTNLTVRLPAAVIGLGLTAVDSAVEIMHYYPKQVLEFTDKYKRITDSDKALLSKEDIEIAEEFIAHAALFKEAKNDREKLEIIKKLGGVTICYRGNIKDSPAYRLNHEEIEQAMAIGAGFKEQAAPAKLITDENKYAKAIEFTDGTRIDAKTVLVAIGTEQNDFQDIFKTEESRFSYFGDCNQKYSGSVVKALASAKDGYPLISEKLCGTKAGYAGDFTKFTSMLDELLKSTIKEVNILTENIVELVIKSPLAAKNFQPGQFFRLQNLGNGHKEAIPSFELNQAYEFKGETAQRIQIREHRRDPQNSYGSFDSDEGIIEPLALTGSDIDTDKGVISLIILEMGKSSLLCRKFTIGQEVVLMGPTGAPTEIAKGKNVALVGGGLGNAALLPIGKALRAAGSKVIYFAGYKKACDLFYKHKIEESSDMVIWSCEEETLPVTRDMDLSVHGMVTDGIIAAGRQGFLADIDLVICIGSDRMMRAISQNRESLFGKNAQVICSVNSPMQCMMKGICGQCIQKTNNEKGYIFSCACQDQPDQNIDFEVLSGRLGQNSLFEKV
jgi:RPE3 domain-containing protein